MSRWSERALWSAGMLSLVNLLALLAWWWPCGTFEGHTSGVWGTLAWDLTHGQCYRPLLSPEGWGGTRYMPGFFACHAALLRWSGDVVGSGVLLMGLSALAAWLGVWKLLRQQGHGRLALPLSWLFFATIASERILLQLRCDYLATALVAWTLVAFQGYLARPAKIRLLAVAALAAAAFMTKFTSIYVLVFCAGWLGWRRQWAQAAALAVLSGSILAFCLAAVQFASGGAFLDNFRATATSGMDLSNWWYLYRDLTVEDPLFLLLLLLGTSQLPLLGRSYESLLLWLLLGITAFIYTSEGIWTNHFLDPQLGLVLVLGAALRRAPQRALATGLILSLAQLVSWIPGGPNVRRALAWPGIPQAAEIRKWSQRLLPRDRPYFCEDNIVALLHGTRPFALDEFTLRAFQRQRTPVGLDFEARAVGGDFAFVILPSGPLGKQGPEPLPLSPVREVRFWNYQVSEFLLFRRHYRVVAVHRPFAVLQRVEP